MSAPQSTIYICSGVRLDNRYEHSIFFADATAQQEYFAGKVVKTFPAYSYLRKTWPLQVQATMEEARSWSYLYFRNGTGKYYYYFISNIEYKNDNTVELSLELDVLQTYLFSDDRVQLLDCFVERQHTATDEVGEHTVDEGLETGELVDGGLYEWADIKDLCILVLSTINPNYSDTESPVQALSGLYNHVFSGLKVWAVNSADWGAWGAKLDALSEAGFLDGIVAMWMYPKALVNLGGENTWSDNVLCKVVDGAEDVEPFTPYETYPKKVDGYTPTNNKLLTYPYSMLYASNNTGGSAVYRWERFHGGIARFAGAGSLSPEGVVRVYPVDYNGLGESVNGLPVGLIGNYEYGLTLGGFPACAWDADVYKMWLAQNQNQHTMATLQSGASVVGGAIAGVAGLATGNLMAVGAGVTSMISGGTQIASLLAQKKDMQVQPPQSRGNFSSSVNVTAGKQTFSFYKKSVSAENARIIDDFFTMYGYRLNRVQKPNINARPAYTYVKTVGCKITGNLCTEDLVKIEGIFDRGITFWKDGDKIGDYSQNNKPQEV